MSFSKSIITKFILHLKIKVPKRLTNIHEYQQLE